MPSYKLSYFAIRGLAETARYCFVVSNTPFEDNRYPFDYESGLRGHTADKEAGVLALNMGRIPLLFIDGVASVGQSHSIERFLAKEFGLFGSSNIEAAQVDMIGEHIIDIDKSFSKASVEGDDKKTEWMATEMPKWCEKLETVLGLTSKAGGCAVGSKLSLADIQLYAMCQEFDAFGGNKCKAAAQEELAKHPKIKASIDAVANNAHMKAYIAKRPATIF